MSHNNDSALRVGVCRYLSGLSGGFDALSTANAKSSVLFDANDKPLASRVVAPETARRLRATTLFDFAPRPNRRARSFEFRPCRKGQRVDRPAGSAVRLRCCIAPPLNWLNGLPAVRRAADRMLLLSTGAESNEASPAWPCLLLVSIRTTRCKADRTA
jgi:hypothetical protein